MNKSLRTSKKITLQNPTNFKKKLLYWAQQYNQVVWLDSNNYPLQYSNYDAVLAIGLYSNLQCKYPNAFDKLKNYRNNINDYIFGYLTYDLKNDIEKLTSQNFDGLHFPDLYFFQPKKLFFLKNNILEIKYLTQVKDDIESDLSLIKTIDLNKSIKEVEHNVKIKKQISKKQYLKQLNTILKHINRGNIYEVNFCQEFYSENATINSLEVYNHLNSISNAPFASFLKLEDKFIISASPERFVKKQGNKIISQPIKGTAKRLTDKISDQQLAIDLANDQKERSENIMIVDLVRNDLSKTAIKGSVKVEELCKVYTFDQVHQMISTISSTTEHITDPVDIIKSLFPMGSMTGAPKLSAMQIIEKFETTKRSVYSGAIGYFTPEADFDFNVVIRSIFYNKTNKYLSYSVGGAITAKSDPEKEYEECLVKAIAMKKALKN
ncbi:anthranilate synthase component I family protein [Aureibaculum marinum]|uniref:Anthranilate synthase component I family protein n=1 Tax=Aureibaculum marinum TaxID=2487930 RepID=A0A3N4P970_9FLAO|nr:anthranilate synthase component I family protein [Aureibaculum marinum]RPE00270.1 anthranilate synthase component I family protein [Aureibaculum marinum]